MKKTSTLIALLLLICASVRAQWNDLNFQVANPQATYTFGKLCVSENGKNIAAWGNKLIITPYSNTNFFVISSDAGVTWKELPAQKNTPENLFWADDVLFCQDSLSLKKSTDFGTTFTTQKADLFTFGVAKPIFKISSNNWLIIQGIGANSTQEQSTDQGITWSPKGAVTAAAIPIPFSSLVAKNGNYVSTSSGETVYSTDQGMSWERGAYPPSTFLPGSPDNVISMADNGDLAYCTPVFKLLFKSTDNGVTWTKVDGLPANAVSCRYYGNKLVCIASDGSTHVSEDSGVTFSKLTDPAQVINGIKLLSSSLTNLFATDNKKIYRYGNVSTGVIQTQKNTLAVKIYPNPASSLLGLTLENNTPSAIYISDIYGTVLLKEKHSDARLELNVESLKDGIYFITIQTNKGTTTQKFVKQ